MRIYKMLCMMVALMVATTMRAQSDPVVALSVSTPVEDNGDWRVDVSMDNTGITVTSLQFDLSIPSDLSYTAGNYLLTSRATVMRGGREVDTHSVVSTSVTNGGSIRVIIYSSENTAIKGESGALVSFYLSGSGTANATPCNLTNIVASTMVDGVVSPKPEYAQAVINDNNLPCADFMDNDILVIGEMTPMQQLEMVSCIMTNPNIVSVDLSRCTNASLGLLPLQDESILIICHHEGQVSNSVNVVYKSGDEWQSDLVKIDDAIQEYDMPYYVKAKKVQYERTFNNTAWQALYLPVAIPVDQIADKFDIAEIRRIAEDAETITLVASSMTTGTLEANTPYFIRAHATGAQTLEVTEVDVATTVSNTVTFPLEEGNVEFTGIYNKKADMYESDAYAMAGGTLKKPTSSAVMLGCFRWFMKVNQTGSLVKRFIFAIDNEEDAIEGIQISNTNEYIYDLSGRRVQDTNKKGSYIINGKKQIR